MIEFAGQGILLDIEGTTSSLSFVHEVMFPFVRRELGAYLHQHLGQGEPGSAELAQACDLIARDAGHASWRAWVGARDLLAARALLEQEIFRLMDGDVKSTGLKRLQGLIWRTGFESGELLAHVYDDVPPALSRWCEAGLDVRVYSSGSVEAQRLFFGHTIAGDLLHHFRGHYDTTTGPKKEPASYSKIAAAFALPPARILFISDVLAELDAATAVGFPTALSMRPGNAAVPAGHGHRELTSFEQVRLLRQ